MAKELKLTFTGEEKLGEERILTVDHPILVGRSRGSDIRISRNETEVSGQHLEFRDEGADIVAFCVGQNGFLVNEDAVAKGESHPVRAGDVLTLGHRVRLRIDSISGEPATATLEDSETAAMDGEKGALTLATIAAVTGDSATFATRAVEETFATRPFEPTFATKAAEPTFATKAAEPTFATKAVDRMSAEPVSASKAVLVEDAAFGDGPTHDDAPTPNQVKSVDFNDSQESDSVTFTGDGDSATNTGTEEGKTREMHTRAGSMDEILRMKRVLEIKKRQRTRLLIFSFFAFVAVIGTIVFVRWPRDEEYLTLEGVDMATHDIVGSGGVVEMSVGYPNDRRARVSGDGGGVTVETYVGRKLDVPFRLQLERLKAPVELDRSLAESVAAAMAVLRTRGCSFIQSDDDAGLDSVSQTGVRFFEIEERASCNLVTQRGTCFIRREYVKNEGGAKWHGNLTVFRNGDVCYRLSKEIPEDEWPRGKYLLRDSFLILRAEFLRDHWESPGKAVLCLEQTDDALLLAVHEGLETNRIADWPQTSAQIDTLVARSWGGPDDRRRTALDLLKKFRAVQNEYYSRCRFRFEAGRIEGDGQGEAKMRDAYKKCKDAFGWNDNDRRGRLINDPKEWTCQVKH